MAGSEEQLVNRYDKLFKTLAGDCTFFAITKQHHPYTQKNMSAPLALPLLGKKAIVTGASRGIGARIAQALALSGASVVLGYSSGAKAAEEVIAAIQAHEAFGAAAKAAGGKNLRLGTVGGKLSDAASAKKFAQDSLAFFDGSVDIVVHNAAVMGMHDIASITEEQFDDHFSECYTCA